MHMQNQARLLALEAMMRGLLGTGQVAGAAVYHLESGGNRTRAVLAFQTAEALRLDQATGLACACAVELLHNASLIHDDLQERDPDRRGRAAVWRKYDSAVAVSAGDLMISAAFASLASHPQPAAALGLMHAAISETARGQAVDLGLGASSLDDYRRLAAAKTGPLLALPVRLALIAARESGDQIAADIGKSLAIAYQIRDDLEDRDADRAAGRINLCAILQQTGLSTHDVIAAARKEVSVALVEVQRLADLLPRGSGVGFHTLANRLDAALLEHSHAA